MWRRRPLALALGLGAALAAAAPAQAQLDRLWRGLPGVSLPGAELGEVKIGAALKEALQVGTGNAVDFTGRLDGYFANAAIKILMPERLRSLERGLRLVGYGPQVDEFVLSMNRAAERAAPAARQIFFDAIGDMTFADARSILEGPDTAATDYFKEKTTDRLTAAFRPVIERTMNEVGVTHRYRELTGLAQAIPFLRLESLDLDRYVVDRALDGLFHVVASEERRIRTEPAARVNELLRDVFGAR